MSPSSIKKIYARQVYDSRGNPTVEVELTLSDQQTFRSIVPSGASTGENEAVELRDGDKSKYLGKGVLKAVENVNKKIAKALIDSNLNVTQQKEIDDLLLKLDGTPNKANLGANAILGVSIAVCRAGAAVKNVPLYQHIAELTFGKAPDHYKIPVPSLNVLNGGVHAGGDLAFQEFMIMPIEAPTFAEALRIGSEVYHHLKIIAKSKYGSSAGNVGDEGGIAPALNSPEDALDLINEAIKSAGYNNSQIRIALDPAASEIWNKSASKYNLDFKNETKSNPNMLSKKEMVQLYEGLIKKYNILSVEDPFDENDFESFTALTASSNIQIVTDDLTCTNPALIAKAIEQKAGNALLLKVNQIGSLSESLDAVRLCYKNNWSIMVSHRSGETEDTFIADLTVGIGAGQLKSGAPCRSERLAKYNQLIRIEDQLGSKATYAGGSCVAKCT